MIKIAKHIFIICFVFSIDSVCGQNFTPFQWEQNRKLTVLSETEDTYPLYFIKKREDYQLSYDEEQNLISYNTFHNIIKVNTDEALNQSNKIYIPLRNTIEVIDIKARAITKNGKIVDFDQSNIKELEDDESGYKILAIEGAEVGGEIEYYYTLKSQYRNFMTRTIQSTFPIKNYRFSLSCPENLEFDFKLYNDSIEAAQTDDSEDINKYELVLNDIPPLYDESFSDYQNSKIRLEAKLAYNSNRGKKRLFTWADAGLRVYDQIYQFSSNEKKEVAKLIKKMKLPDDTQGAISKAEHYIKTNFRVYAEANDDIEAMINNKYASSRGFTRMFAAILNQLEIGHELVLTSDRFVRAFDPKFDTWNYLDEYIIYINDLNKFMSPDDVAFRIGTIPHNYIGTYGLFIRPEKVQDFVYPISHIGLIPEPGYESNHDNMDITATFNNALDEIQISLARSFRGYSASYYKAGALILPEPNKKEMLESVVKYLSTDAEIDDIAILEANNSYEYWDKPFTVGAQFRTKSYIESAGDIVLFKLGELIGPQSELYQENERKLDVINEFNRGYLRKIKVDIPKGYTIQNAEDIVLKDQVYDNERLIYTFESTYELNGQTLEVEIIEYYDQLRYSVDNFEPFRKVINAAADWNKVILVLSK